MERLRSSSLVLFITLSCVAIGVLAQPPTHNVIDFGAVGDGKTDDFKAFMAAWNATCEGTTSSKFLVPGGKTFLLGKINFTGPCKSNVHVQVDGNLLRPSETWAEVWDWIAFRNINNLTVDGSGRLDAQGSASWNCMIQRTCKFTPRTMSFAANDDLVLSGLTFINSSQKHVVVAYSKNVVIQNLNIIAPEESPNTDGIYVAECENVQIKNCTIGTGDDCISMGGGITNLNISDITCGPGHGISIGSLGGGNGEAKVEQIRVRDSTFTGTMNGARIKTWQGGSGYAKGISFENINFTRVWNPIIIDQFYCPHQVCSEQPSAVKVSDVKLIGITGTTMSDVAINFNCSRSVACEGIVMERVSIQAALPESKEGRVPAAAAYCNNARGIKRGVIVPHVPCLTVA